MSQKLTRCHRSLLWLENESSKYKFSLSKVQCTQIQYIVKEIVSISKYQKFIEVVKGNVTMDDCKNKKYGEN